MCRGGRTDLLLLQMAVRSSESEVMSWFWPISPVSTSRSLRQFDRILQNVLLESCDRQSNSLTFPFIFHKKNVTFLPGCKCSFARCLKGKWSLVHDHIFCATYSVPKISFCSISFAMNTERKLDLFLMAYIPVSVWLTRMSRSLPFPCLSSGAALSLIHIWRCRRS